MTPERFWILMIVLGVVTGYAIGVAVMRWLLG
jgi:hypothetical protein